MAGESGAMKLQIKQEQYATDTGGYFPVWNVYRDDACIAMCFSADDAREVYEGLICWAMAQHEAAQQEGAREAAQKDGDDEGE